MVPVTVGARMIRDAIREAISSSRVTTVTWCAGDLLIVDNLRLLHGRGEAARADEDRVLARVLIRG